MPRAVVRVVLVSSGGGGPQIMDATQVLVYTPLSLCLYSNQIILTHEAKINCPPIHTDFRISWGR